MVKYVLNTLLKYMCVILKIYRQTKITIKIIIIINGQTVPAECIRPDDIQEITFNKFEAILLISGVWMHIISI